MKKEYLKYWLWLPSLSQVSMAPNEALVYPEAGQSDAGLQPDGPHWPPGTEPERG